MKVDVRLYIQILRPSGLEDEGGFWRMSDIIVEYTDGTKENFPETSRAGGSWCTSIKYTNGFAIIRDAYDKETAIPCERIKKVIETPSRGRW